MKSKKLIHLKNKLASQYLKSRAHKLAQLEPNYRHRLGVAPIESAGFDKTDFRNSREVRLRILLFFPRGCTSKTDFCSAAEV